MQHLFQVILLSYWKEKKVDKNLQIKFLIYYKTYFTIYTLPSSKFASIGLSDNVITLDITKNYSKVREIVNPLVFISLIELL